MSDLRLIGGEWVLDDIPNADDLGWVTVDIGDGSWTQSDPSGIILNTISTVNDITKVTYNAVGAPNNNYDPTINNDYTGPRWYAKLELTDGTRINSDDIFIVSFEIVIESPTTQDRTNILIGVAEDPTSTVIDNINFTGQMLEYSTTTANASLGVYTATGAPVLANNANNKIGFSTFASVTNRIGNISAFNLDSSSGFLTERSTTSNRAFSSSTDLFLMIQAGLSTGAVATGACDIQAKLRYRIIKFNSFPL